MTPDQVELARRAVACRRWRWVAGSRYIAIRAAPLTPVDGRVSDLRTAIYPGALPDLSDPATLGCLLALVREAWGEVMISANATVDGWVVNAPLARNLACCDTEVEALVAALEAAP